MGARIEPCETAAQRLDKQFAIGQESLVHRGDFQFSACGGLYRRSDFNNLVGIEVQAGYGVIRLRLCRFLLDGNALAFRIEFRHAVTLRIGDPIAENGGHSAVRIGHGLAQLRFKPGAMEDIVSQHHAGGIVSDEFTADDESLGQTVRRRLFRISEVNTIIGTVPQQPLESRQVMRRGDDEDIPDSGHHQHGDRIVDHRLIVDGQELLGDSFRDGIEAGSTAAGEHDSFHRLVELTRLRRAPVQPNSTRRDQ